MSRYPHAGGVPNASAGQVIVSGLSDTSLPELRGNSRHAPKNIALTGQDHLRGPLHHQDLGRLNTGFPPMGERTRADAVPGERTQVPDFPLKERHPDPGPTRTVGNRVTLPGLEYGSKVRTSF